MIDCFYNIFALMGLTMEGERQQDNRSYSSQHQQSKYKHFKAITIVLLTLIIAQIVFYSLLSFYSTNQTQAALLQASQIPEVKLQLSRLMNFSKEFNIQPLQVEVQQFSKEIEERQRGGYDVLLGKTLHQLQERQQKLQALKKQVEAAQKIRRGILEETTAQYIDASETQYAFVLPKKLWVFDPLEDGYFSRMNDLYRTNNQRVAKESSFDLQFINQYNYILFVDRTKVSMATRTISILRARMAEEIRENKTLSGTPLSDKIIQGIQKTLIMLLVLEANGGVAISEGMVLLEQFDWLRLINKNTFINRAKPGILPRAFGFYNISRSSPRIQEHQRDRDNRFKFLVKYPGMMPYFLAAIKHCQLINDLLRQITQLLQNPATFISKTEKMRKVYKSDFLYFISHNRVYDEYFQIATMTALLRKEYQMNMDGLIGLDHYGLVTMNCNYWPEKIGFYFQYHQGKKILRHLTQFQLQEFQLEIGPNRYMSRLPAYYQMNDFADNLTQFKTTIIKNSFFHRHFFPNSKEKFIINRPEIPRSDKRFGPWQDLPRVIWVYWSAGIENSNIIYQLCADNLRRNGLESGFQLNIVSDYNIHEYLDNSTIQSISYATSHQASLIKTQYIKYDLIRLALVARHGGIYMDLSYILLENLDWLVNIAQYPSNLVFNRYGSQPKALLFFHPHYGSPFNYTVNTYVNSKAAWQLGYENNFIAAVKDSQLINEWFDALLNATQTPYQQLEKQFIRVGINDHRWTSFSDVYLLAMDMVKYVVGRKQKQLQASGAVEYWDASDYYKVWSLNGYMGQQKFRRHTSYDTNTHDNLFLRVYTQADAQQILGKPLHLIKLYNYPVKQLLSNFVANYHNLTQQFHQESIFMHYLYNSSRHEVEFSGKKQEKQRLIIRS